MTIDTKARRASSPSKAKILAILEYTSPTKAVSGPKIIPSRIDKATNGNKTPINLLRISFIFVKYSIIFR